MAGPTDSRDDDEPSLWFRIAEQLARTAPRRPFITFGAWPLWAPAHARHAENEPAFQEQGT